MLLLNDFGSLFPDWSPFDPVGRILSSIGLTEEEVSLFEAPFEEFRHQRTGNPLRLPENIRTSDEWFRLLFNISSDGFEPNQGYFGQINLDNIGGDFLCLIYYRQRILDLFGGGLNSVLSDVLRKPNQEPSEYTSLTNSLIPVEALTDFLSLRGTDFSGDPDSDLTIVLTDPPQRRMTLREFPSPVGMFRDTTGLSRYIRNLSVCLQDGGLWDDLSVISHRDFGLSDRMTFLRDRRTSQSTRNFGVGIALSREFCLWDINRGLGFPSIRQISDRKRVPYLELLRVIEFGDNNLDRGGIHRFEGLSFLRDGFSDRLRQVIVSDIEGKTPKVLTKTSDSPIL